MICGDGVTLDSDCDALSSSMIHVTETTLPTDGSFDVNVFLLHRHSTPKTDVAFPVVA